MKIRFLPIILCGMLTLSPVYTTYADTNRAVIIDGRVYVDIGSVDEVDTDGYVLIDPDVESQEAYLPGVTKEELSPDIIYIEETPAEDPESEEEIVEDASIYIEETQSSCTENEPEYEPEEKTLCMPISDDATLLSDVSQDYIVVCKALKVRTEPDFSSDKVYSIPYGKSFTAIKTITLDDGKSIWGVLEDGYICLYSHRLAHARISFDLENEGISDADILARLMLHEARGEGEEGMSAVAEVVRNRMNSDLFPDTLREVVFQPGQFESVYEIGIIFPTEESLRIAQEILDSGEGVLGRDDILYFRNAVTCGASPTANWGRHKFVVQINHHSFYTQN